MITWKRGENVYLGQNFFGAEFQCQCGKCEDQQVDPRLIEALEELRALLGRPIKITSGYRCKEWQQKLSKMGFSTALGTSTHELGQAADIVVATYDGKELAKEAKKIEAFKGIGTAEKWIHVDVREKPKNWTYARY